MSRLPQSPLEVRLAVTLFPGLLGVADFFRAWQVPSFAAFTPRGVAATVAPEQHHAMAMECYSMSTMREKPVEPASLDRPTHRIARDLLRPGHVRSHPRLCDDGRVPRARPPRPPALLAGEEPRALRVGRALSRFRRSLGRSLRSRPRGVLRRARGRRRIRDGDLLSHRLHRRDGPDVVTRKGEHSCVSGS